MAHWDGFMSTRTTYRDCWTVEVAILNGGKNSPMGLIPIIFIPYSSSQLYKASNKPGAILRAFLHPFLEELEHAFIEGFDAEIFYPDVTIPTNQPQSSTNNMREIK